MVIRVTAVDDDGSARRLGAPSDNRRPIKVNRGEDVTIDVVLVTPAGVPVELALPTDLLRMTVTDTDIALDAIATAGVDAAPGRYQISLAGTATADLPRQLYGWDLWIRKGSRRAQVVGLSEFRILDAAAERSSL